MVVTQTVTRDGAYTVVTFTGTGSTSWIPPAFVSEVRYLVIGGGGGGGGYVGGGGGAGGFRTGTLSNIHTGQSFTVTVGTGGTGARCDYYDATNGGDSVFATVTATGGGKGGHYNRYSPNSGGSGGGGCYAYTTGGASSPVTSPVQGYKGGNCGGTSSGGGGGASEVGHNGLTSYNGGQGGAGAWSDITGTNIQYAGGGGAGTYGGDSPGDGGEGGGGAGGISGNDGNPGTDGKGGGGGGSSGSTGNYGGNGGSGVVILRYALDPCALVKLYNWVWTDTYYLGSAVNGIYPGWLYKAIIGVVNPPATTGYQVQVTIQWQPGMKDDFSDLRFSDYKRTLPYWIETSTTRSTATVWVKLTEINEAAKEFFCYYGNGGASSESSGTSVFELFDHFDGSSLNAKWTSFGSPSITIENSLLKITSTSSGAWRGINATSAVSSNTIFGVRIRYYSFIADSVSPDYGGILPQDGNVGVYGNRHYTARQSIYFNGVYIVLGTNDSTSYYNEEIHHYDGNIRVRQNGGTWTSSAYANGSTTPTIQCLKQSNDVTIWVDWAYVRKYQSTEPTCTPLIYGLVSIQPRYFESTSLLKLNAIQHLSHIDLWW